MMTHSTTTSTAGPAPIPAATDADRGAVRQLLYTNTDRVVDGARAGGWQILARSPTLDDAMASRLLALVEPRLNPVAPLSGFPTPEEVGSAARRLAQVPTADGTVLVHTAPAGADATGRPNTMTHIAVLADEKRPAVCTADLWRSPGWRVPFGPDEVRATRMPAAGEIIPGRNVSDDSVADFMAESGRAAVLVALADLLGDVLARRADAPADKTTTVLLGTDSTDEAALWVGALQRTCAPCTGRRLGFSTLERVGSARDIESLMASGVDLACVPRRDLEALSARRGVVVVDPQAPPTLPPATAWARLVAGMTTDLGAWVAGVEAVREVLDRLSDHRDLTPGWPLAMAEACDPGVLTGSDRGEGPVDEAADHELVACQPRAVADDGYLVAVVGDRVLGSTRTDPAYWYDKLSALPERAPAEGVVTGLARKYVETAVRAPRWLLEGARRCDRRAADRLSSWSGSEEGRRALGPALETAVDTVSHDRRDTAVLVMVDRLTRDGVVLPGARTDELLLPAARALAADQDPTGLRERVVRLDLARRCRARLARLVEQVLREEPARDRAIPWMSHDAVAWLGHGAMREGLTGLTAQIALTDLVDDPDAAKAGRAVEALNGVTGSFEIRADAARALAAHATVDLLRTRPQGWRNAWDVLAPALLADPRSPTSAGICRELLAGRAHPEASMGRAVYTRFSVPTAVSLVVLVHHAPLMTRGSVDVAVTYASNVLVAVGVLGADAALAASPTVAAARSKALAVLTLVVWNGRPVRLPGHERTWGAAVQGLDAHLDRDPGLLAAPGETGAGRLLARAVDRLYWCDHNTEIPEELFASVRRELSEVRGAEERSSAALGGRDETVRAIVRAWYVYLGPQWGRALRDELVSAMAQAPDADRWLDGCVLPADPARGASGLRRRLFGGHRAAGRERST